jgi:hypothetical protein
MLLEGLLFHPHLVLPSTRPYCRLYTHGFDLFAPAETVLYHLYSRAHRPAFQTDRGGAGAAAELVAAEKARSVRTVRLLLQLPDPDLQTAPCKGDGNGNTGADVSGSWGVSTVDADRFDRLCRLNLTRYGLGERWGGRALSRSRNNMF